MASEDVQSNSGNVDTQSDEGSEMSSSTASRLFDDLRTRLDTPLFARDPGMTPSTGVPRLKELTWEHVVNTGGSQPDEDGEASMVLEAVADEHGEDPEPVADVPEMTETDVDEIEIELGDDRVGGRVGEVVTSEPVADDEAAPAPQVDERPASSEPSLFARIMAGDMDRAPRSGEHAVVTRDIEPEEPVLRIAEPAPAPRPSDPVVDGLAELIARTTPETTPTPAPSVAEAAPVEPVLMPERNVQAEIDRLAFVPDSDVDEGPVEVPAILVSGVVPAVTPPATPAVAAIAAAATPTTTAPPPAAAASAPLSLAQGEVFTAKSSSAPANPRQNFMPFAPEALPTRKKKKRHGFRRFVTMLVLLGMVGGGLFAVKKYVIDARWDEEVKAYADDVAVARGLEWKQPVGLEALPAEEYATKLAVRALGDDQNVAEEWRAMGLLQGGFELGAIGMAALPDSPAFYDPSSGVVYVVDGIGPELRDYAIHRALAMALLDQEYDWSGRIVDEVSVVALGTRALYEADALATAQSMIDGDEERGKIVNQTFALFSTFDIPASPSPWASTLSGRLGVALWPYFRDLDAQDRDAVLRDALVNDGQVLDLRRLVSTNDDATVTPESRGMLYWYHVLAARIDDDLAWRVALAWEGDEVVVAAGTGGGCMAASLTVDSAVEMITQQAFDGWMATAPLTVAAPVLTKLTGADVVTFTVQTCDPGTLVPLDDGGDRLALGGAPLRTEQFRLLLDERPTLSEGMAACAAYGADPVTFADERGVIDPVGGWGAPANHPAPDPVAAGCVG